MLKKFTIFTILLATSCFVALGYAAEFKAKQPILITSGGQSVDGLMIKILAAQAKFKFTYNQLAEPDDLKENATLIFVAGGSAKGLGAAGIDEEQELARVQRLIDAAKEANKPIITMHVGGKNRRGTLSDTFNRLTAEHAHCLIVDVDGDEDGLFSGIAEEKEIPIHYIEITKEAAEILKDIFDEGNEHNE